MQKIFSNLLFLGSGVFAKSSKNTRQIDLAFNKIHYPCRALVEISVIYDTGKYYFGGCVVGPGPSKSYRMYEEKTAAKILNDLSQSCADETHGFIFHISALPPIRC